MFKCMIFSFNSIPKLPYKYNIINYLFALLSFIMTKTERFTLLYFTTVSKWRDLISWVQYELECYEQVLIGDFSQK